MEQKKRLSAHYCYILNVQPEKDMEGKYMGLQLHIPDSVVQAIRLPEGRKSRELLIELSIALYSQEFLSFGKARELADMGKYEFGQLLGKLGIIRHYGQEELEDDLKYVRS